MITVLIKHLCIVHPVSSVDRPDSPLLPRCSSYDAPFFSSHTTDDDDFKKEERLCALRCIVKEMAHLKYKAFHPHTHDKPLPAPPPSPASRMTPSLPRAMCSHSSLSRVSCLPSDQSRPQVVRPSHPVSVIVHDEYQHDLVLRDWPIIDGYSHKHDSFPHAFAHSQDLDSQYLSSIKDSVQPSPTLSNFSFAYSHETSFTTPYSNTPVSPASAVFSSTPCSPVYERTPLSRSSQGLSSVAVSPPKINVSLASSTSHVFPPENTTADYGTPHHLRTPESVTNSQSRWSSTTTASHLSVIAQPKLVNLRTSPKEKKGLKIPPKRTHFPRLVFRFSPSRTEPLSTTTSSQTGDDAKYDHTNDSDSRDREKNKPRISLSKKSSLASLRSSFSLSRSSFSSQRTPTSSSVGGVPPLPTSPTLLPSSMAETSVASEVTRPLPNLSLSKIPFRGNILDSTLPPIPQSASTITTF
ncbi:hypothetical protein V8E55_007111 [Tylopilus felleus]